MSRVKAKLIIEADQLGDSTYEHCPPGYTRDPYTGQCVALMTGEPTPMGGSGGGYRGGNPASHPPAWALKNLYYNSPYSESSNVRETIDNSDAFINIVTTGSSIGGVKAGAGARLRNAKLMVIKNCGKTGVEVLLEMNEFNASDVRANSMFTSFILGSKDWIVLPTQRIVNYSSNTSAGNASSIDNTTGGSTLYIDSGADTTEGFADDDDNTITFDDASGGVAHLMFRVGDLIRIDNEVMRVTSIVDTAGDGDYTPAHFIMDRALYGTAKADHSNNAAINFAVFNEYGAEDKFTYLQTDKSGKLKTSNLILNAGQRSVTAYKRGIVRGSFAMKFYENGYQELGLSGITNTTSTGLAASTTYQFNITADGGSVLVDLAFTTDSSNVNFGGTNGVLSKINDALSTQYSTYGGNLFEKRVSVSIVNGDVRFSSGNRTNTSAILLAAPGSGTTPFGVGRFPAIGDVETPVAAKLPDDTLRDSNYIESPNDSVFAYDDGKGNIKGLATGTINYETSAIDIIGPANAEPAFSFNYASVHSGGIQETSTFENGIISIQARSCNSKINSEVEVIGFM